VLGLFELKCLFPQAETLATSSHGTAIAPVVAHSCCYLKEMVQVIGTGRAVSACASQAVPIISKKGGGASLNVMSVFIN